MDQVELKPKYYFIVRTIEIKRLIIGIIKVLTYENVYEVIIRRHTKRSLAQNALYWVWIEVICDYTGYTEKEMHSFFKDEYLESIKQSVVFGKRVVIEQTTTDLKVKEFTAYLNQVELFSNTEIGLTLPHPKDLYYEALGIKQGD
jgi:hypothetical protein